MESAEIGFLPAHGQLTDEELLEPRAPPFSRHRMFVCTYVARLENLKMGLAALTDILCDAVRGGGDSRLIAVNSNYGHAAVPGCEHLIRRPRVRPGAAAAAAAGTRPRKVQGDGTCFNSALEPIVRVADPRLPAGKIYKCKLFPTTGEVQVPGVILPDFSDGRAALAVLAECLAGLGVVGGAGAPVAIANEAPNMINHCFALNASTPRMMYDLDALNEYALAASRGWDPAGLEREGWAPVRPPFPLQEIDPPVANPKFTFKFRDGERTVRVNIFQRGKINTLGARSRESAEVIYAFFEELFAKNWRRLVCLEPRREE